LDEKTTGAWIIHHTNKLNHFAPVGDFERLHCAGKCGLLLSAMAADDQSRIPKKQVDVLARANGINAITELPALLQQLVTARVIQVGATGDVEVIGVATSGVLTHTTTIYTSLQPTEAERAVITLAETVSAEPIGAKRAAEFLGDVHRLAAEEVQDVLKSSEEIGFTDAEAIGNEKIYFNGHIFRRDGARKMQGVMSTLTGQDEARIREVDEKLKASGCLELSEVTRILGSELFGKLQSIGVYDVNTVRNSNETTMYVTRPSAFAKYGNPIVEDAMDLAKALVASLMYGMKRSSYERGQITMIDKLLRKLIAGGRVGSVRAIGEDYRVLEVKRVVQLEHDRDGKYFMRLLKRDVGELALAVLTTGDASDRSVPGLFNSPMAAFVGPEQNRVFTRRDQLEPARRSVAKMIHTLRTGG
jgi:hypothetical protein